MDYNKMTATVKGTTEDERTTDIEILADRWIKSFYGKNAKEVIKEFPAECRR